MSNKYDYLFKLIVIGDTNTGKSCLLERFTDDTYISDFISTIGVDFKVKTINIDDKIIKTQIWDTAGQCRFRSITNSYYRGAHGIIISFDITNKISFKNIEQWIRNVKDFGSDNSIKLIIGTKSDLIEERQVSKEEIDTLVNELNINYIETSAKENNNINEVFVTICKEILTNMKEKINTVKEKRVFIDTHLLKKNKYNCCW
jgi:Ras-related protein Rab-1A